MKKLFALSMCLICMALCVVPAAAAGTELTASAENLQVGDTVALTVSVSGADAAKSVGIAVNYNSNNFELVSGEWCLSGAVMAAFDASTAKAALMYAQTTDMNGDMFEVTLRAKSPAKTPETVSVEVDMRDGAATIYNGTADVSMVITATEAGTVPEPSPEVTVSPDATQPPAEGIQGTVNVPTKDALQMLETAPSQNVVPEVESVEESSNVETLPTTEPAAEQGLEAPAEETSSGFPWYIVILVAAIGVVAVLVLRRKKTR